MVTTKNIIIFCLIGLAGLAAFFWFYQSDETKIKKRFSMLSGQAGKDADETELAAALKARKIAETFAESCRVDIPSESVSKTFSREDIPSYIMLARNRYLNLSVKFYDIHVNFPQDGIAEVDLTASVEAKYAPQEPVNAVHELKCTLEKFEKDWFFSKVEEVDVLVK